jgi:hypothetical protein
LVENQRLRAIANGQSPSDALESAKAEILASIGDVDLTADYIAASASGDETAKAAAERVHVIARAVTGLLADAKQEVATAIDSGDLTAGDTAAVFSVAINQIVKQVSVVVSDVETALASINSRGLSNAERAAALTDRIKQLVIDNDVVDAATLPALVEVDRVERTALTASEMLFVDGGVWIGEVDVEVTEFVETGENGETSTGVIENIFVGFVNLGIIENGETATSVIESGETSTSVIESGETSTSVIESGETSTSVIESGETSTVTIDVRYNLTPFGDLYSYVDDGVGLTDNGWQEFIDLVTFVTNSDGSVSCDNAVVTCEISNGVVIDLDDQDIASVMENYSQDGALWRKVLQSGFSFSEGSKGYSAEITNGLEYTLSDQPIATSITFPSGGSIGSLSDLINSPFDYEEVQGADIRWIGLGENNDGSRFVLLVLKEGGAADYLIFNQEAGTVDDIVATVNYTTATINGEEFIQVPRAALPLGFNFYDDDGTYGGDLVFSIFNLNIRYVEVDQAGTATVLFLDTAANDELINAIDLDKLCCEY